MKFETAEELDQVDALRRALADEKVRAMLMRFFSDRENDSLQNLYSEAKQQQPDLVEIVRHSASADVYSRMLTELDYLTRV